LKEEGKGKRVRRGRREERRTERGRKRVREKKERTKLKKNKQKGCQGQDRPTYHCTSNRDSQLTKQTQ
jgi:hypothetical protein